MRRTSVRNCAGAVAAAALLALTGCTPSFADSASAPSSTSGSGTTTTPATTTTHAAAPSTTAVVPAAAADFCTAAGKLVTQSDPRSVDTTKPDAAAAFFARAAQSFRSIDAPAGIAPDWKAVGDGLAALGQAYRDADLSSQAGEDSLERSITQIQTQVGPAQNRVDAYLEKTCGISVAGSAATSGNHAPVLVPSPKAP